MSLKNRAFLLISPLFLAGCVATQQDMLQMQSQMDDLNNNLNNMQKNQADLAVKMDGLSDNLNMFSENIRDLSAQMDKLSAHLNELDSVMSRRVNAIGQTIKKQQEEVETTLLPAKLYNDAYNCFLNNNIDAAINGFKNYLAKFPGGDMAESCYYYLGESLYLKERWQDAALSYATILDKYPKSPRTASARLKYALALLKLPENKRTEALEYLESITKDFPGTQEARAAKDHIARLKSSGERKKAKSPAPAKKS